MPFALSPCSMPSPRLVCVSCSGLWNMSKHHCVRRVFPTCEKCLTMELGLLQHSHCSCPVDKSRIAYWMKRLPGPSHTITYTDTSKQLGMRWRPS